jgi:hypothetical protein
MLAAAVIIRASGFVLPDHPLHAMSDSWRILHGRQAWLFPGSYALPVTHLRRCGHACI